MSDPILKPVLPGIALRRWRLLHRVKQTHAAQLFNVTQSTISRWESGVQAMEPAAQQQLERLLGARLNSAADQALARLVNESQRPMHLICDVSHRLLACSPARAAEFSRPLSELLGQSLWRYATAEILLRESALASSGWHEIQAPAAVEFVTGRNDSEIVPIRQSLCRWTRIALSDGTATRLVETL
ncbi:transcriptional regulator [Pseudomonas koreensis]|uniref:Transcriptional regulator n=1 Tax=Pseudomonas koreensis TaxID=198620 RepID=A0AAC9BUE0_9PSED|nr:helix-turn-helix transcriptional regulator [Pseudomonas koreensis]ANH98040.1 transcriptional regulator [Pseudomonas koreensis]MCM8744374.1 helix-turn-helix domain-containing protein [Pseudomonas koreensis]